MVEYFARSVSKRHRGKRLLGVAHFSSQGTPQICKAPIESLNFDWLTNAFLLLWGNVHLCVNTLHKAKQIPNLNNKITRSKAKLCCPQPHCLDPVQKPTKNNFHVWVSFCVTSSSSNTLLEFDRNTKLIQKSNCQTSWTPTLTRVTSNTRLAKTDIFYSGELRGGHTY